MKKSMLFILFFTTAFVLLNTFFKEEIMDFSIKSTHGIKSFFSDTALFVNSTINKKSIINENNILKEELLKKDNQLAENTLLKRENQELKNLLNIEKSTSFKIKTHAQVYSLQTETNFLITADKGKNHGIKIGDTAVFGQSLIGKVSVVFDDFCQITPITAFENSIGITTLQGDMGIVTGKSGMYKKNLCALSFFGEDVSAYKGEKILTSGLSDIYPKGLSVGRIYKTGNDFLVKTDIDFFKLRTLTIGEVTRDDN